MLAVNVDNNGDYVWSWWFSMWIEIVFVCLCVCVVGFLCLICVIVCIGDGRACYRCVCGCLGVCCCMGPGWMSHMETWLKSL